MRFLLSYLCGTSASVVLYGLLFRAVDVNAWEPPVPWHVALLCMTTGAIVGHLIYAWIGDAEPPAEPAVQGGTITAEELDRTKAQVDRFFDHAEEIYFGYRLQDFGSLAGPIEARIRSMVPASASEPEARKLRDEILFSGEAWFRNDPGYGFAKTRGVLTLRMRVGDDA